MISLSVSVPGNGRWGRWRWVSRRRGCRRWSRRRWGRRDGPLGANVAGQDAFPLAPPLVLPYMTTAKYLNFLDPLILFVWNYIEQLTLYPGLGVLKICKTGQFLTPIPPLRSCHIWKSLFRHFLPLLHFLAHHRSGFLSSHVPTLSSVLGLCIFDPSIAPATFDHKKGYKVVDSGHGPQHIWYYDAICMLQVTSKKIMTDSARIRSFIVGDGFTSTTAASNVSEAHFQVCCITYGMLHK